MNAKTLLLLCCLFLINATTAFAQFNIVPLPGKVKENGASFTLTKNTKIYYEPGLKPQADLLNAALSPATGFDFEVAPIRPGVQSSIVLRLDKSPSAHKESYKLSVTSATVS